jgi:hypothetical protein
MVEQGPLNNLIPVSQASFLFWSVPVCSEDRHDNDLLGIVTQLLVLHELNLLIDDTRADEKRDGDRELSADEGPANPPTSRSGSERTLERFVGLKRGKEEGRVGTRKQADHDGNHHRVQDERWLVEQTESELLVEVGVEIGEGDLHKHDGKNQAKE